MCEYQIELTDAREHREEYVRIFHLYCQELLRKFRYAKRIYHCKNRSLESIMKIETKRLYLRELTENDFSALYDVLADSDIMQHYPYTFDENRVRNWIVKNIERYNIFGFGLWAVCLKETGEMIGDCGLTMQLINDQIKPEIGYHIRADKQRKGYAKEAAIAVRDWTFNNTPFNMVYSYMKYSNEPSAKTAMSYGAKQVDGFSDEINEITKVFAISREEWINRKISL